MIIKRETSGTKNIKLRALSLLLAHLLPALLGTLSIITSTATPADAQTIICEGCDAPGPNPTPAPPAQTSAPSGAQTSAPAQPSPTQDTRPEPPPLSNSLAAMTTNAKRLLTELSRSITLSFRQPIMWLAAVFGAILICVSISRLTWEADGPVSFISQFFRLTVCLALFWQVGPLFKEFDKFISTDGSTTIDQGQDPFDEQGRINLDIGDKVRSARFEFDTKYQQFTEAYFKDAKPDASAQESVGRLWDLSKPWYQNIDRILNPNDWDPSRLFSFITLTRALFSFTELSVGMLWAFVRLAFLLTAPLAIAAGIDGRMASRMTYPYLQGLAVFYCVWPPVADCIRLASYKASVMTLDAFMKVPETERLSELGNPVKAIGSTGAVDGYAVMAGCAVMLVATAMQFGSPFLAYKAWNGQIFEAITTQTTQWIGAISGAVAEVYGARVSADIDNAARALEIKGNYESTIVRAEHQRDAALLGARANRRMAEGSAEATRIGGTTAALANRIGAMGGNRATRDLQVNLAGTGTQTSIGANEIARAQQLGTTAVNRDQRVGELNNRKNYGIGDIIVGTAGGTIKEIGGGLLGSTPLGGIIKGGATIGEGVGHGAITHYQYEGLKEIQKTASRKAQEITNNYIDASNENLRTSLMGGTIMGVDVKGQIPSYEQFKADQDRVAESVYATSIGGVDRGYGVTTAAIRDSYGMNVRAADTAYSGDTTAAAVMRRASMEAASAHRVASIIQNISRSMDRKLEQAIAVRL